MLGHLRQIMRGRTVENVFERSAHALRRAGFSRVYFQGPIGSDRSLNRVTTNFGFPEAWQRAYVVNWQEHDPFPDAAARRPGALYWQRVSTVMTLSDAEKSYLDFLQQNDMAEGICMLQYGNVSRVGLIAASPEPGGPAVETLDREFFELVGMTSFMRFCQLVTLSPDVPVELSGREQDVLYWMAQGCSNGAIADILGIGQDTVQTYVKRIFTKMKVFDRTSAVMKGVQYGLVIVSDPIAELVADQIRNSRKKNG